MTNIALAKSSYLQGTRIAWCAGRALLLMVLCFSGCSRLALPEKQAQAQPAENQDSTEPADTAFQSAVNRSAPHDDLQTPEQIRQVTAKDDSQSDAPSRPGLIGGLRNLIQANDVLQDAGVGNGLLGQLDVAATQLEQAKQSNRMAIRQANRQARVGRNAGSPNIVLIQLERAFPVFHNDASLQALPNLYRLAANGLCFTRYYAGSSDLKLARWCLLSGKSPNLAQDSALSVPEGQSLASLLWNGGYSTAFLGQWRELSLPIHRGYEEWVGFDNLHPAIPYPASVLIDNTEMRLTANAKGAQGLHSIDLFASEAVNFLQRHQAGRRPFLLQISLPDFPGSGVSGTNQRNISARLDAAVGKVLEALDQLQLTQNTCIVLTAESGTALSAETQQPLQRPDGTRAFDHGLGEGNLRVPLVISWPGQIQAGTTDHLCAAWDLFPTFLELTSTNARPPGLSGISFVALLRGKAPQDHPLLYWSTLDQSVQAVRKGDWKGIHVRGTTGVQLFDLKKDPGETTNLAQAHPEIVQQLIAK